MKIHRFVFILLILTFCGKHTIAQMNHSEHLNMIILNDSMCQINGQRVLFSDLACNLNNKAIDSTLHLVFVSSQDRFSICFQRIIDVLTTLNRMDFKIRSMQPIIICNISFGAGKFFVPESTIELDKLADFLINNENLSVEICRYSDNKGSSNFNKRRSQMQAETIIDYLVHKGVQRGRMKANGLDEKKSLIDRSSIIEQNRNGKTELRFIYNEYYK